MLTCSNCGATIREGAKFCTSCGTRLNDSVAPNKTSVWTPASSDKAAASTTTGATDWSGTEPNAPAWERPEPEPAATATSGSADTASVASDDDSVPASGGFSWSWGDPIASDDADAATKDAETESAPVSAESASSDTDVAAADPTVAASDADETSADTTDKVADVGEADSESLAEWAEKWNANESEQLADTLAASDSSGQNDASSKLKKSSSDEDDDGEDTVAKAERLIGELKAMIPSLARPRPGRPSEPSETANDHGPVADDLENAAKVGQFDDVREALLKARDNPRDVDNVLNLSNQVDRLLELLDDRNNLAKTAQSAATRIRGIKGGAKPTLM